MTYDNHLYLDAVNGDLAEGDELVLDGIAVRFVGRNSNGTIEVVPFGADGTGAITVDPARLARGNAA